MKGHIFSFDVESVGLLGEGYAVGALVLNAETGTGLEYEEFFYYCDPSDASGTHRDFEWVRQHIPDFEKARKVESPAALRHMFSRFWIDKVRQYDGLLMVCDCPWPVESRFLLDCARENGFPKPYPIIDVASVRYAKGLDPLGICERLPDELPVHNPLADARQSARLFLEAMRR